MRKSSQAERMSRPTTKRMPSRLNAAFAPTQGNSEAWMKDRNRAASG
jgi:hypothetical protein